MHIDKMFYKASPTLWVLALAMLILSFSELLRIYYFGGSNSAISRLAFLALFPALLPYFSLREWVLTLLAGMLTLGLIGRPDGWNDINHALDRAAFFAAFIFLVTPLKEAAQRSRSVLELGMYVTRQSRGRRYFSLAVGGHFMGVLLNFGAISLLTPLIQRGAKAMTSGAPAKQNAAKQMEQQQISALLRGFSWMIMWSPTALTQAVLFTSFPSADPHVVIPLGIGAAALMILIGWIFDRQPDRTLTSLPIYSPEPFPKIAARHFGFVCITLILLTFSIAVTAGVSAAVALMLVAPIIMVAWIFQQNTSLDRRGAFSSTLKALEDIFIGSIKDPARSAFILGVAGYIGVVAAKIAPVGQVASQLNISTLPVWVFLMSLPILITLGGQVALSPIMIVVFLSAVINELPVLPADPNLIVFALGAGWALSMTASPNASATLLISAITKIPPTTLTWRWNGTYSAVCFAVFVVLFFILAAY